MYNVNMLISVTLQLFHTCKFYLAHWTAGRDHVLYTAGSGRSSTDSTGTSYTDLLMYMVLSMNPLSDKQQL